MNHVRWCNLKVTPYTFLQELQFFDQDMLSRTKQLLDHRIYSCKQDLSSLHVVSINPVLICLF